MPEKQNSKPHKKDFFVLIFRISLSVPAILKISQPLFKGHCGPHNTAESMDSTEHKSSKKKPVSECKICHDLISLMISLVLCCRFLSCYPKSLITMHTLIMTLLISRPNALALTNPISNSDYFGKDFPNLKTKKKSYYFLPLV